MLDTLKKLISSIAPTLATALGGPLAGIATSFLADKLTKNPDASVSDIVTAVKADPASAIKLKELDNQFKIRIAEIALESDKLAASERQGQIELNKIDAASDSLFRSGWRPAIGWIGVIGLLSNYVLVPYLGVFGIVVPPLDLSELMPLVLGLLGFGAFRSYEKVKGI